MKPNSTECNHAKGPTGYIERLNWFEIMSKRYKQEQCNNCKLWVIWRKK